MGKVLSAFWALLPALAASCRGDGSLSPCSRGARLDVLGSSTEVHSRHAVFGQLLFPSVHARARCGSTCARRNACSTPKVTRRLAERGGSAPAQKRSQDRSLHAVRSHAPPRHRLALRMGLELTFSAACPVKSFLAGGDNAILALFLTVRFLSHSS